jgi:hypothetical protein
MMAAAAEHGGGGQQWRRWATTAMADNNSGGRRRRRMMTACKVKRRTIRGKEEGGRQTTMALSQLSRERETNIKKSSLRKKDFFQQYGLSGWIFFSNMVCPVGVFAPTENKLLSFYIYQS